MEHITHNEQTMQTTDTVDESCIAVQIDTMRTNQRTTYRRPMHSPRMFNDWDMQEVIASINIRKPADV